MRPEPNNDIDLLLRQLSRRDGAPVSEIGEQHLDADELNSYVANALPAAARGRYTAHLADCLSCRTLVVELSAAQGTVSVRQSETVVAPSGLKSFLASLFSPMVLRYAVPAVGLIVIAVIGIVVVRRDQWRRSVALNDAPNATKNVPQGPPSVGYVSPDGDVATKKDATKPDASAVKEDQIAKAAPVTRDAPPVVANQPGEATGAVAAEAPPPASKAVSAEQEAGRGEKFHEEKKTETTDRAAARDATKEREADKNEPPKQKTEEVATVTVAPGTAARKDVAVRPAKSSETAVTSAGAGQDLKRAPAGKLQSQSRSEGQADDAAGETRSVAGRRFRRSGRVWIDTAFDSSKSIINVARGSEHYRALVADEPSIRTIADQLEGEIIVVWKGSTYCIR